MWQNASGQHQLTFLNCIVALTGCGIGAASLFSLPVWGTVPAFGLVLAAAFVLWRKGSRRTWLALLLLFLLLGFVRMNIALVPRADDIAAEEGKEAELSGIVLEAPRISVGDDGVRHLRYTVELKERRQDGEAVPQGGRVYVYAAERPKDYPADAPSRYPSESAHAGDKIHFKGKVMLIRGYGNPGTINPRWAAEAQGVTAAVRTGSHGTVLEQAAPQGALMKLRRWAEEVRAHYLSGMRAVMPEADAAAIFAMLFGGYEGIRPELLDAFTTTGIVHILSVSGSHITLLAGTLARLGGLLRLRRGAVAVFVIVAVVLYGFLAGGVPPVIRSGAMGILSFLALVWGRERDARRLLSLTCLMLLLYEPRNLFDISFQLSFGATAGLLYLAPPLTELLLRVPQLPRALAVSCGVTCGAQLSVLPLIGWYFHVISLSSLPANLLAVPFVELIIMLGLAAGLIGFAVPWLAGIIYAAGSLLLGLVYELTRLLAKLPGSRIYLPPFGALTCLVYYVLLLLLFHEKGREKAGELLKERAAFIIGLLLVILPVWGWLNLNRPQELQAHFIDVGQGDAALFITPHGKAFMVDTGGTRDSRFDVGARVDVPYLLQYGVRKVEAIFLTHAHEDHAAGARSIVRLLPTGPLICAAEGKAEYIKTLQLSAAEQERIKLVEARQGMAFNLDGVRIEVIYAPQPEGNKKGKTGNELCNVIRVSYGKASFLLTGDISKEEEARLLHKADPQATVLKVAHHGSKTSGSPEFLQAVRPRWAVISVSRNNTFGHPHPQTLENLQACGAEVLRTDRDGAVVFRTDGERMKVETYRRP